MYLDAFDTTGIVPLGDHRPIANYESYPDDRKGARGDTRSRSIKI